MILEDIDYYVLKEQIETIERTYKHWMDARSYHNNIPIAIAVATIAKPSDKLNQNSKTLFLFLWKQRFQFEELVMSELNKI